MAELVPCPQCGYQFDAAGIAPGEAALCPQCRSVVVVSAPGATPTRTEDAGGKAPRGRFWLVLGCGMFCLCGCGMPGALVALLTYNGTVSLWDTAVVPRPAGPPEPFAMQRKGQDGVPQPEAPQPEAPPPTSAPSQEAPPVVPPPAVPSPAVPAKKSETSPEPIKPSEPPTQEFTKPARPNPVEPPPAAKDETALFSFLDKRDLTPGDVDRLAALLRHADPKVRARAATHLGAGRGAARAAVGALVRALEKDEAPEVRRAAAHALGEIGADAIAALPALTTALQSDDAALRPKALQAIVAIGPSGTVLATILTDALRTDDPELRSAALTALAKLGPDARPAYPALGKLLTGPDPALRLKALAVLEKAGPSAAEMAPQLATVIADADPPTRARILKLAASIKCSEEVVAGLVPELSRGLQSTDADVCRKTLDKIAAFGPDARYAAQPVAMLFKASSDPKVRTHALKTLAALREGAEPAIPTLLRSLKDAALFKEDRAMYERVKETLAAIGRPAVAPLLKVAEHDPLALNRLRAIQVIDLMGPDVKDVVVGPLRGIRASDPSASVRDEAEAVLNKLQ